MRLAISCCFFCLIFVSAFNQTFVRTEITTDVTSPWEILYGPDDMLWITETSGRVTRIDPGNGQRQTVYAAPDYSPGSLSESLPTCFQPIIGKGTLGMDLHPDFLQPATAFIYYLYSYNSVSAPDTITKFKIVRLHWDATGDSVLSAMDLVTDIPTSYDHLGGRMKVVQFDGAPYIFLTLGDHGVSEDNSPSCYTPQSLNPNNFTQDPDSMNGKIHRFNIDGSIPTDNPISGNSFWSRGHRNPQGLMYNPFQEILYDAEHGDRTDDEVNVIYKGMNYGWKQVRGYHGDNNFPGEDTFITNYAPHPAIPNDSLVPALWSWCDTTPPTNGNFLDWCTVAPSGGAYYGVGNGGIPGWENSLLVVTLKNGTVTDQQVFRFKLNPDGRSLAPSTPQNPNPSLYFGGDQVDNGRLRDIAISSDGLKIYLINNGGTNADKIIEYAYTGPVAVSDPLEPFLITPNPVLDALQWHCDANIVQVQVFDPTGRRILVTEANEISRVDVSPLPSGIYILEATDLFGQRYVQRFLKD